MDVRSLSTVGAFDSVYNQNVANGFELHVSEIRPSGDGWELVELTAMMTGHPQWKRVAFNRNREECVAAANRRGLTVRPG